MKFLTLDKISSLSFFVSSSSLERFFSFSRFSFNDLIISITSRYFFPIIFSFVIFLLDKFLISSVNFSVSSFSLLIFDFELFIFSSVIFLSDVLCKNKSLFDFKSLNSIIKFCLILSNLLGR